MRKTKEDSNCEKKEKLIIKYSIQEQIAKNEEDIEKVKNPFIKPFINKLENEFHENKFENHNNKFDMTYTNSNNKFDYSESNEDLEDQSNIQNPLNIFEENIYKDKENKNNKKKKKKKNSEPFKSTAKDFKIKYKTELCKYYEINGYCKYGDSCAYAHGKENLRSKITNTTAYRTKNCVQFFQNGYCPYGNRCQFAHQVSSNIINNPYDKNMTYKKILETVSKQENIENIKGLVSKPRLSIFKEIVSNDKEIKSTLLDDIKNIYKKGIFERIDDWIIFFYIDELTVINNFERRSISINIL